jgi:hypothetical protein
MFADYADYMDISASHPDPGAHDAVRPERRRRVRMRVHWPVSLVRNGESKAVETVTDNLSSSGFYCVSPAPLTPGESLVCILRAPAHDPTSEERAIALECRILVMRADATADGHFGIACLIEDYRVLQSEE